MLLAKGITTLIVEVLGKRREATSVLVEEAAEAIWMIGGTPMTMAVHVDAKITKGTNSEQQKREFLARTSELFKGIDRRRPSPASHSRHHDLA